MIARMKTTVITRLATPTECIERDKLTYLAWGATLTESLFLKREERLRAHTWAKQNMKTWVLASSTGNQILSSFETFKMKSSVNGMPGHSYGIASVFTEERFRGNGYASQVLQEAFTQIEQDDSHAQSYLLFSEVGPKIYERLGFSLCPSHKFVFKPEQMNPNKSRLRITAELDDVRQLLDEHKSEPFTIRPTIEQLDWHWERSRVYAELLDRPPQSFFALHLFGSKSMSTWMADYKNNTFRALTFIAENPQDAKAMIEYAQSEALRLELDDVRVWQTPETRFLEKVAHGKNVFRDDALAMIRFAPLVKGASSLSLDHITIPRALWI